MYVHDRDLLETMMDKLQKINGIQSVIRTDM